MKTDEKDQNRLDEMIRILKEIQHDRRLLRSVQEFYTRTLVARAIVFDFEQLGEIANRLSLGFVESHSDFPLREIKGFRNVVVHDYSHLDEGLLVSTLNGGVDSLLDLLISYQADSKGN